MHEATASGTHAKNYNIIMENHIDKTVDNETAAGVMLPLKTGMYGEIEKKMDITEL